MLICRARLLEYCVEHGAYTGCEFNRTDADTDDLLTRMSELKLDGTRIMNMFQFQISSSTEAFVNISRCLCLPSVSCLKQNLAT